MGFSRDIQAVTASGKKRTVARLGDNLTIQDISSDGRVLVTRGPRSSKDGWPSRDNESSERGLDWLDVSLVVDLSADGALLLFEELGAASGAAPAVYLRRADRSPAVHLGEGYALALSPNGRWALVSHPARRELLLLPTGVGEPKVLDRGQITDYQWATFLPDGERIVAAANERDRGVRLYVSRDQRGEHRVRSARRGSTPYWVGS